MISGSTCPLAPGGQSLVPACTPVWQGYESLEPAVLTLASEQKVGQHFKVGDSLALLRKLKIDGKSLRAM